MKRKGITRGLKASDLVRILQKKIKESGDLEINVNTQDGGGYGLYSEDDVKVIDAVTSDGSEVKLIEIG